MAARVAQTTADVIEPEQAITELWWVGVIQAALAIFFGVTAIFWPGLTLLTLVYIFSGFILALGLIQTIEGLMSINRRDTWWITLLIGLVGIGVGVYLISNTDVSLQTFILVVGISLIARGILDLARVFMDRVTGSTRILYIISGIVGFLAGIVLLLQPIEGGVAFVWVLGLYALFYGVFSMTIALGLRSVLDHWQEEARRITEPTGSRTEKRA